MWVLLTWERYTMFRVDSEILSQRSQMLEWDSHCKEWIQAQLELHALSVKCETGRIGFVHTHCESPMHCCKCVQSVCTLVRETGSGAIFVHRLCVRYARPWLCMICTLLCAPKLWRQDPILWMAPTVIYCDVPHTQLSLSSHKGWIRSEMDCHMCEQHQVGDYQPWTTLRMRSRTSLVRPFVK